MHAHIGRKYVGIRVIVFSVCVRLLTLLKSQHLLENNVKTDLSKVFETKR